MIDAGQRYGDDYLLPVWIILWIVFFCQQSAKFAENNPIKTIDMQSKFEWKKIKTVYHLIGWNIRTKYVYDKKKAENKYDRA